MDRLSIHDLEELFAKSKTGYWKLEMENGKAVRMYADPVMLELMGAPEGITPEELCVFFTKHIHPGDLPNTAAFGADMAEGEAEFTYRYLHPTQGEVRVRCCGRKIKEEGSLTTFVGYHKTLTDVVRLGSGNRMENQLVRRNRSLRQAQERSADYYGYLLDKAACGIFAYTLPEQKILHMNAEALRIYGFRDTGIGMSQEFLKHIFDPFTQERVDARSVYQGTGLGMAIVKNLLEQMGGSISIESEVGVGTTFTITIPFEIAPAPEEKPKEPLPGNIRGLHLMLVEDNTLNAEIAQVLLKDAGAIVTTAENGKQAVDLFTGNEPGTFDGILMDVMMPVMDGLTAARTIRDLNRADAKAIPIIAMSANAFQEDVKRSLQAGMNAHLAKPLDMARVTAVVAELCGR